MKLKTTLLCSFVLVFFACRKSLREELQSPEVFLSKTKVKNGEAYQFMEIGSVSIGGLGAAEISAFDSKTNKLFVVNNSSPLNNKIDVLDFKNPSVPVLIGSISMAPYGGAVNSVDAKDGLLAAGIESLNKQESGKLVVFNTADEWTEGYAQRFGLVYVDFRTQRRYIKASGHWFREFFQLYPNLKC